MRAGARIRSWLRATLHRSRMEREMESELRFHIERYTEDLARAGVPIEEARRRAGVEFGAVEARKEECREAVGLSLLDELRADVRYALRMLRKAPAFTTVAIVSLGLGIGANTAIFSLLNAVVLKTLPVPHPEELVQFSWSFRNGQENSWMSFPYFLRFRQATQTLSSIFAYTPLGRVSVGLDGKDELAEGQLVTGGYFATLGLRPAVGRFFTEEDDQGHHPVAVISNRYWQRRFGGDSSIVGKVMTINKVSFDLVGVTSATFVGLQLGSSPDITVPMSALDRLSTSPPDWNGPFDSWIEIMGRLKPGVARLRAQAEFDLINRRLLAGLAPTAPAGERAVLNGSWINVKTGDKGFEGLQHDFSAPLQLLMMMVGIVLLIACANVANLLLARAAVRQREIAVRLAIGAGRARLIRQLLTEGIVLGALGGVLGFIVAWLGSTGLIRMVSTGDSILPVDVTPDLRILAFTASVSLLTGILFGLAPAYSATRVDLTPALKEGRGQVSTTDRRKVFAVDRVLVAGQVGLALMLLVCAGLFMRSLQNLWAIDPGYDRNNVLMFSLDPHLAGYSDGAKLGRIYRQLLSNLRELPDVRSVSASLVRPVDDEVYLVNVVESIDGHKLPENNVIEVAVNFLASRYFATMGTPMLLGREFGPEDNEKSARVAVISEKLARECFGNENPIGRYLSDHNDGGFQVIGVVRGSRYGGVRQQPRSVLYLPFFQEDLTQAGAPTFEVRYSGALSNTIDAVRHAVSSIDANLPLFRVKTLEVQTADSLVTERLIATLSTFFGLLAGLLACIGLYGTMAYRVARRTGEIGIRMALGAQRRDVRWMVLRETVVLIAIGTVIGLLLSIGSWHIVESRLYGVKSTDVLTLSVAALFLASVAVVAGYVPARRASLVDPVVALRYE